MLILKKLYSTVRTADGVVTKPVDFYSILNCNGLYNSKIISFDLYDTKNDKLLKSQYMQSIIGENVLGILQLEDRLVFIPVDDVTWKLLDYINIPVRKCNSLEDFDDAILVKANESIKLFRTAKKDILVVPVVLTLTPLDENCIFWEVFDSNFCKVTDLYNRVFSSYAITADMDAYIQTRDDVLYKLDINREIVRFATKIKTLKV